MFSKICLKSGPTSQKLIQSSHWNSRFWGTTRILFLSFLKKPWKQNSIKRWKKFSMRKHLQRSILVLKSTFLRAFYNTTLDVEMSTNTHVILQKGETSHIHATFIVGVKLSSYSTLLHTWILAATASSNSSCRWRLWRNYHGYGHHEPYSPPLQLWCPCSGWHFYG